MNPLTVSETSISDKFESTAQKYAGPERDEVPVWAYVGLLATFSATFAGLEIASRKIGKGKKPRAFDYLILSIASYKVARVVTMNWIGTPLRAPFTERGHSLVGGEIQDHSRGSGLQKAIGNLLTCPFCFSVWAATAFIYGLRIAPRATKNFANVMVLASGADILNFAHRYIRERL